MTKKNKIFTIFLIISIRILLDFSYVQIINPLFNYEGMFLKINYMKFIESYILLIAVTFPLVYLLEKKDIPSKIIVFILTIFLFLPLTSIFWLQDQPRLFLYFIAASLVATVISLTFLPGIKFIKMKEGKFILFSVILIMTFLVYGVVIMQGGLSRINLNLLDVYETRSSYAETNNFILGYFLPWQAYGVNMVILAISLYKKNYKVTLLLIFIQVLLFSMTNFKSFLFAPLVLIGFHFFSKTKFNKSLLFLISLGSTSLVFISITTYYISKDIFMIAVFVRRLFFVPANLHYIYYDFFGNIEKYKLSHSVLSPVFNNDYEMNPVKLVAFNYFHRDFSPNIGFFGDAYLNFGLFGIVVFTFILIVVLKIVDTVSFSIPIFLSMSILIIPAMALINSAFLTSLLTHGIIFSVFLLWLLNSYFLSEKRNIQKSSS